MVGSERLPRTYQQDNCASMCSDSLLTQDEIGQQWTIRTTRTATVLIPGHYNWRHYSMALGTAWNLPEGVKPAWSSQFDGLGCEYVGPVLTANDPTVLQDLMNHPPTRKSVHQLARF